MYTVYMWCFWQRNHQLHGVYIYTYGSGQPCNRASPILQLQPNFQNRLHPEKQQKVPILASCAASKRRTQQ